MLIRAANKNDTDAILALYREQFDAMSAFDPYACRAGEQDKTFVENGAEDEATGIFVAECGGEIVGFALAQEKETPGFSFRVPRRYAYLMDVIVHEEYRGRGFGTALIDAVWRWAKEKKLDHIELSVLAGNDTARNLYMRLGFRDTVHVMRIEMPAD